MAEAQRAEAEAAKNRADTVETIANAELKKAQAQKLMFEMQSEGMKSGEEPKTYKEEELLLKAKIEAENLAFRREELELRKEELEFRKAEMKANKGESK
jgi:hypothetical protein